MPPSTINTPTKGTSALLTSSRTRSAKASRSSMSLSITLLPLSASTTTSRCGIASTSRPWNQLLRLLHLRFNRSTILEEFNLLDCCSLTKSTHPGILNTVFLLWPLGLLHTTFPILVVSRYLISLFPGVFIRAWHGNGVGGLFALMIPTKLRVPRTQHSLAILWALVSSVAVVWLEIALCIKWWKWILRVVVLVWHTQYGRYARTVDGGSDGWLSRLSTGLLV